MFLVWFWISYETLSSFYHFLAQKLLQTKFGETLYVSRVLNINILENKTVRPYSKYILSWNFEVVRFFRNLSNISSKWRHIKKMFHPISWIHLLFRPEFLKNFLKKSYQKKRALRDLFQLLQSECFADVTEFLNSGRKSRLS